MHESALAHAAWPEPELPLLCTRPMPLPLAFPVGLLLGMHLAWLARAELARSDVPLLVARPFLVALGLGALVFGPVAGYFAAWHDDWAHLYVVPSSRIPSAVDLALVLAAAGQIPIGFAVAAPWAVARRGMRLFRVTAGVALVLAIASVVSARRLSLSASYAQYHGGFGGVPLGRSTLGRGILLSWATLTLAYGFCVHALRSSRDG